MGKAPLGLCDSTEYVYLTIFNPFTPLLVSDVSSDSLLVQTYRTHAVPGRPEMQTRHPPLFQKLAVNSPGGERMPILAGTPEPSRVHGRRPWLYE